MIKYVGNDFEEMAFQYYEQYDSDGNPQWKDITPNWETGGNIISSIQTLTGNDLLKGSYTGIATSNTDPNIVYVACSRFHNNEDVKVMWYTGSNWVNYSQGIPLDEEITSMVIDPISNDGLYAITERGFYFRDKEMPKWISYNNNLPQLLARQIEINFEDRTVRAGTYGRGIWKSGLKCPEDITFFETGTYSSDELIEGGKIFSVADAISGLEVTYKSNREVTLNPGFGSASGSDFLAFISPCVQQKLNTQAKIQPGNMSNFFGIEPAVAQPQVEVYPNPGGGVFTLATNQLLEEKVSLEIFDGYGKRVFSEEYPAFQSQRIDLSDQTTGLYYISISSAKERYTRVYVKQ